MKVSSSELSADLILPRTTGAADASNAGAAIGLPYHGESGQATRSDESLPRSIHEFGALGDRHSDDCIWFENEQADEKSFEGIVGRCASMRQMCGQIRLVAATSSTVLILGETGSGKELIARAIHNRSPRKERPFIRVNCACIPKDLYESEFFGHVRGAFTGAIKDRVGRFEAAEGGTLFLDEIGEIPIELQSKLLRALQEKQYERVGDERTRRADVRIVTATNRDLRKDVVAGRFREDLFYRLNVFPIRAVPLRDRREDIPLLAKYFVETLTKELKCRKPRLTEAGTEILKNYDWPGNIRELRNVIERAIIVARGNALEFEAPTTHAAQTFTPILLTNRDCAQPEFLTDLELQRRERDNLSAVLKKTGGRIKGANGAAELLGVKSTTLTSRIKKMGLTSQSTQKADFPKA